jgi:hypothetical protein
LVIGWNDHHTAITLADGTPVASGEGGGIHIGGGGAYQAQFTHHMYLPITAGGATGRESVADPNAMDSPDRSSVGRAVVREPSQAREPVQYRADST